MATVTTFVGIVENGQIKLAPDIYLPDKTRVYVVIPDSETKEVAKISSPRLAHSEQAADFKKEVLKVSSDAGL